MQIGGSKQRVKLTKDLTRYDKRCKIGETGWTIPNFDFSIWAQSSDIFVAVLFDNGAELDVLYKSLELLETVEK